MRPFSLHIYVYMLSCSQSSSLLASLLAESRDSEQIAPAHVHIGNFLGLKTRIQSFWKPSPRKLEESRILNGDLGHLSPHLPLAVPEDGDQLQLRADRGIRDSDTQPSADRNGVAKSGFL